jgi:DNA repair protein RadC
MITPDQPSTGDEDTISLCSVEDTKRFLFKKLTHFKQEVFACIFMNAQHRILRYEALFYGSITGAPIYPRILAQKALEYNAAAIILAHNHPSGDKNPSQHDIQVTQDLIKILNFLDITVLDHIVVGDQDCSSFAELGLLYNNH